jgi:hypothetical protein
MCNWTVKCSPRALDLTVTVDSKNVYNLTVKVKTANSNCKLLYSYSTVTVSLGVRLIVRLLTVTVTVRLLTCHIAYSLLLELPLKLVTVVCSLLLRVAHTTGKIHVSKKFGHVSVSHIINTHLCFRLSYS